MYFSACLSRSRSADAARLEAEGHVLHDGEPREEREGLEDHGRARG